MHRAGATGAILGLAVGAFGFVLMRDPMKFSLLSPGEEGYYQRIVLARWPRISLRILGVLVSLFGMGIFSAALGALLKVNALSRVSDGLLVELGLLFVAAWSLGIILAVVQTIRGHSLDWFQIRKRSIALGPIAVYPPITPAMERESRAFTVAFIVLVGIAVCAAVALH